MDRFNSKIYEEISDTFNACAKTIDYVVSNKDAFTAILNDTTYKKLFFTGCGTSFYICRTAESVFALNTGRQTMAVPAGDALLNFDRYKNYLQDALVVTFSRSGKTAESLRFFELVKKHTNAGLFAILCNNDSPMGELADYKAVLPWALDTTNQTRSVANMTAAFIAIVGLAVGRPEICDHLKAMSARGNSFLSGLISISRRIAKLDVKNIMVAADAEACGLAEVGALMFDEVPFLPAQYRHVMDSLHGPICTVNKNTLVIMYIGAKPTPDHERVVARMLDCTQYVVLLSDKEPSGIPGVFEDLSFGMELLPEAAGIPLLAVCLMISLAQAVHLGHRADFA